MFYKVKVFDSRGHLKEVVSSKKLSNQFWRNNSTQVHYEEGYTKPEEWGSKGNIKAEKVNMDESL